jgi:hypothetical protein
LEILEDVTRRWAKRPKSKRGPILSNSTARSIEQRNGKLKASVAERFTPVGNSEPWVSAFTPQGQVTSAQTINWESLIRACSKQIDLTAYLLRDITDNYALLQAVEDRANNGVKIRILLPDPEKSLFKYSVKTSDYEGMKGTIKASIEAFKAVQDRLTPEKQSNFDFRLLQDKGVIDFSFRRLDDTIYIGHYMYSIGTSETPIYVVEGEDKPLFHIYSSAFVHVYNLGSKLILKMTQLGTAKPD